MNPELVAVPPDSGSVSANNGVPVPEELSYRSNVTVPVGLAPPLLSPDGDRATHRCCDEGCCVVSIDTVDAVIETGSPEVLAGHAVVVAITVVRRHPIIRAGGRGRYLLLFVVPPDSGSVSVTNGVPVPARVVQVECPVPLGQLRRLPSPHRR